MTVKVLVGEAGVEPAIRGPEPRALPLGYSPTVPPIIGLSSATGYGIAYAH